MVIPIISTLTVLKQLSAHCFIHNCQICFKPYDKCYCYCVVCKAYIKFGQQILYDEMSTYEDELEHVIALSGRFKNIIFISCSNHLFVLYKMKPLNGDWWKLLNEIDDNSVDLVFCDLPYGQTQCKWDCGIDLAEMWKQFKRIRKDKHTPFFFTCSTRFGYELIKSNGKWFRYDLVWENNKISGVSMC